MQLSVARRVEGASAGELVALLLLGFGAGAAAGFLLSEAFGTGGPRRMGRLLGRRRHSHTTPAGRAATLERVREALAAEPALASEPVEARARGRGIELCGWVTTRGARGLAYRVAGTAAGPVELVNHLLVRGEDDRHAGRESDRPTARPASA